jgi:hypothetical protein
VVGAAPEIAVGRPRSPNRSGRLLLYSSWVWYCSCDMTTEAVRTCLELEPTSTEQESTSVEVKQTALEQESAATTGGVWRCSCGQEFGKMEAIGGHISRKKNKADHKNLGFGPSLKVTQARSMSARHTCSILAPYPLKAAPCPLAIPAPYLLRTRSRPLYARSLYLLKPAHHTRSD